MLDTATGWKLDVERGPDWIFVRVHPSPDDPREAPLAEMVWGILQQNFVYRVVLELEELPLLTSQLVGQLVLLGKRVYQHDGTLRVCGLSADNQAVLHACRLEQACPNFSNRNEAVMSQRPLQPR